ncbi:filamentous hemagglutinin N-terminal domain-containing protein [Scytonema sp. UIC 10036]|uniref:two-partner secretion domain-containing protein n=1 Tax=Scytonema sp. UIC 10036 TaxID=2304196 RepID=UPI0012DA4D02|nr:filamentous hemagglutinin N-terminal domain-containing protein [Scytonema sp. UIC 10036]MUG97316.1 filamentous hemagglutinin N-terminal domain-containing protein [Scytonema sp. UIC 10036]
MTRRTCNKYWLQVGIGLIAVGGSLFCRNIAVAQIVPDNTLGAESSVVTPNVDIKGITSDRIDGGAIRGSGLFHSFQEFNVGEGRGGYFSNPVGVENIFSRVTGANASNIFGKLGVLGNANLFLLNPNGILFGPNASLDIKGSFSASTANSLNFGDGKQFSATNPTAPPLLSVTVPLGVQFNQQQPKAIANSGNLAVGTGQNLTLLGGTVASTGQLSAPSGQVAIAAVPGGSVVNLSPLAQLLNIETSSPVTSVGSSSLTELLTSVDEKSHPGLTVNGNGQVELTGSGLSVVDGDVVARNVTAQTATLTANNNLTLVESQIGTTGDLNLLAGNTVRVRDSVANPFVAQAGGQLLVQGKQGVDIFALSHPSSGLVSGRDMVLRSANTVGGDAHYWTGGSFRIEKLDGSLGGLISPYDPVIRARGDVRFASYTGASLHIFAGGSVTINGTVTITGADEDFGLPEERVFLSDDDPNGDRSFVDIDGTNSPTLDIRAGTTAFGTVGLTPNSIPEIFPPNFSVEPTSIPTSANITVGSIRVLGSAQIFLTNQFEPNRVLGEGLSIQPNPEPIRGSINITSSTLASNDLGSYSIIGFGDRVTIDARGDINIAEGIITGASSSIGRGGDIKILSGGTIQINEGGRDRNSSIRGSLVSETNGSGGNISLTAARNITTTGNITSSVISGSTGNGGNITLRSNFGEINTRGITISSTSSNGNGGDVTLTSRGNIYSGNILARSNSDSQNTTDFAEINLNSLEGTVFLNQSQLNTTNTGTGFAGDISINGRTIQINNNSRIESQGDIGKIFIGIDADNRVNANNVTISNSSVNTNSNGSGFAGDISINGRTIQINSNSRIESQGDIGKIFIGIDADNRVSANNVTISNSSVNTNSNGSGVAGDISIKGRTIQIDNNSRIESKGDTGQIFIGIDDSDNITANDVTISNSSVSTTNNGSGVAGDIRIYANNDVKITSNKNDNIVSNGYFGRIFVEAGRNVDIRNSTLTAQAVGGLPEPTGETTSRAGDIKVTSRNGKIEINNSFLFTSTGSQFASAGDITLTARRDAILINDSDIRSRILNNQPLAAGNIEIYTDKLTVDNSEVTVSSERAQAGNLRVFAKTISLNQGILRATTGSNRDEANIFLRGVANSPLDLLHLQNESRIEANATRSATGGNVTINTRLLLALPSRPNGSDISANAIAQGTGGKVNITARPLGVYGIEFRPNVKPSEILSNGLNDITASSQSGRFGIVSLRLPDVDPRRGFIQLPEDLGDSSKFIDPSCPVGGKRARSRFVVTGRGGLPPNPGSVLNSDILLGESGTISPSTNNSPTPTVEAQGVAIGPKGEIILTANPSQLTSSYSPWQQFTGGCDEN